MVNEGVTNKQIEDTVWRLNAYNDRIRKETAKQIFDSIEDIFRMKMNSEGLDEGIWYNAETISMQNIDALKQKYGVDE